MGPLLFIGLSISIYRQIQRQTDVHQSWQIIHAAITGNQSYKLWLVLLLMVLNWGLEARKWKLIVNNIQPISFLRAYRSILSGQALAFNTISPIGDSAGRIMYLEDGNRIKGIVLSIVGSISQILVTFFFGLASLVNLRWHILNHTQYLEGLSLFWLDGLIFLISIFLIACAVFYFRLSLLTKLIENIPWVAKYKFFIQNLESFQFNELTKILLLSLVRYSVYLLQYLILFEVFNVRIYWLDAASLTSVLFLVMAIVPTITLAELGFRGKLSIQLFGLLSNNSLGIIATAGGIWIINLVLPAIAGTFLVLGVRLFRNN